MSEINLTDKELRNQLTAYGMKIGPISHATRKVYIKKLQRLKQELVSTVNGKSDSPVQIKLKQSKSIPTRKNFGFSTDESDSNNEDVVIKRRAKQSSLTTRQGRSVRSSTPVTTRSPFLHKPMHKRVEGLVERRSGRRSLPPSPVAPPVTNGYSDNTSSEDEDEKEERSWVEMNVADASTSPASFASSFTSVKSGSRKKRPSLDSSSFFKLEANKSTTSDLYVGKENDEAVKKSDWKRLNGGSQRSSSLRRRTLHTSYASNESNFLESDNSKLDIKAEEKNISKETPSKEYKPGLFKTFSSKKNAENVQKNKAENKFATSKPISVSRPWTLHFSFLLPIGTVIFFVILGLLYVTMRSDNSVIGSDRLLDSSSAKDEQNQFMEMINSIYTFLSMAAGNLVCASADRKALSKYVPLNEIQDKLKITRSSLLKALALIQEHPEWNMLMMGTKDGDVITLDSSASVTDVEFMMSERPILPTMCRFRRAMEKVLFRVGIVLTVGLAIWILIIYRQYRKRKRNEERQMMFVVIEKILDLLKNHHQSCLQDTDIQPYMPILHARDIIIPIQDRRKMSMVWQEAVRFISASESRVRVESQRISGEDFRVWRWIQVTTPGKKQHTPARVWQGEAFDTNRSINAPNISPTPCLKIRNMFDPEVEKADNWHLQIQDSILEKCSTNNEILSIVVERNSSEGVVYVKCGSNSAAGRAFKSLHGAWFDGRLVTVKFIKLQRFHERYPYTAPLKRSSLKQVSTFLPSTPATCYLTSTPLKS